MATKWKYALLPAEERLNRIRGGNKDVYESEIARSVDVANSRKELGLDTSEQRAWIDRVSYNYNLSGAQKLGISPESVNKTGYADRLLGSENTSAQQPKRFVTVVNKQSRQEGVVRELSKELSQKIASAEQERESVIEWLFNNGIDATSEQGEKFLEQADQDIDAKVQSYKNAYRTELKRRLSQIR